MMLLDLDLNLRYTVSVNNDFDDNNNKSWTKVLVSLIVFPFIVTSIQCFFFCFSSYVIKVMCAVHTFEKRPRESRDSHTIQTSVQEPSALHRLSAIILKYCHCGRSPLNDEQGQWSPHLTQEEEEEKEVDEEQSEWCRKCNYCCLIILMSLSTLFQSQSEVHRPK